jgi:REP element-mobilizing transposase RayT
MTHDLGPRPTLPHRGWHDRGYLPHFDAGSVVQTLTFRLGDSVPRHLYERVAAQSPAERHFEVEDIADRGLGACLLAQAENAAIVGAALRHFDGARYRLLAWAIMPNHVHTMIEQIAGWPLSGIVHAWKSYTAHAINRRRDAQGAVWAPDYFDRFIRDETHYLNAKFYIENNPAKAGLVRRAEEWPFSSASAYVE